ncbi:MAG: V-type ATP synthase subunit A [bacterium]
MTPSPHNPHAIVARVSGPVVTATGLTGAQMYEVVHVGESGLVGEIVRLNGNQATIQVYENTTLLKPGAPVHCTGAPLSVWLGPGLIGNIFDGIQRPLPAIRDRHGAWLERGEKVEPLNPSSQWTFEPAVRTGEKVGPGQTLGFVDETPLVRHRIMVPPDQSGTVRSVVDKGIYGLTSTVAVLDTPAGALEISLLQKWPVRIPRPNRERLPITRPLLTGQRIIDTFFPLGKGGCAAIPGGFGTGKTITQHQLAKWSDADIIVFIGCGERGNEMTEVLREFPKITDPRTGRPLMERTILIANTSNMPVAAREASIYTGITLAEYYRDMGLNVAVFADSTSRWAEALRELAARLEEMPAEEGFPATLPTRLAQFYERGGAVTTLAGAAGSITIVGAVSPPGGDFSEPVTQHTQRFVRCFWALDTELANARHYPSIHWIRSYSDYIEDVSEWWKQRDPDWIDLRTEALTLLQREDRLLQIVKLIGADALPDAQRLILFVAEILKDGFLAQSAFEETDQYCSPERQAALLKIIMIVYGKSRDLILAGVALEKIQALGSLGSLLHAKSTYGNEALDALEGLSQKIQGELDALVAHTDPVPAPSSGVIP